MKNLVKKAAASTAAGILAFSTLITSVPVSAEGNGEITQFMDCFMPMPIIEELTDDCWGARAGLRDQSNGLEDREMDEYCYWDGGIIKDEETGKYYMFASRWNQAGGHWGQNGISGWQGSQAIYAVSDNLYGPYTDMGPIWPDWCDGAGHNVFPFMVSETDPLYEEGYRYAIMISDTGMHGEIANGTIHIAKSLDGPWDLLQNGNSGRLKAVGSSGYYLTNVSITLRDDGKYEAINRNGDIAIADSLEGDWVVQLYGLWWQVEGMPNVNVEDPVIWYADGLYHVVANKWDTKEAFYLTSEDGVTNWVRHSGIAYTPNENFLTYEDGTENNWTKLERPNVYIEDGTVKAFTFAVIDVEKEQDLGNDSHGSKIIVVPFNGEGLDEFARSDVYVDPMAHRDGIEPIADTTAQSWSNEANLNYGGEPFLQLQRNSAQGIFGEGEKAIDSYDCKIAYIKYDISKYVEKEIEDVTLSLVYQGRMAGVDAENKIEIALANSDWEEGTGSGTAPNANGNVQQNDDEVIWSNQPAIISSADETVVSDAFATADSPIEVKIDVTDMVKSYIEDNPGETVITFALCEMNGNRLHIGSKEGGVSTVPLLDVNYVGQEEEEEKETAEENISQNSESSATPMIVGIVAAVVVIIVAIIIIIAAKKPKNEKKS